jgi:RNA polymerase sigma-70 factor (ECF subfamily)
MGSGHEQGAAGGDSEPGARLAALTPRLRLLLQHLAGRAVRSRVELDDLVQEVHLRAWQAPSGLPAREPGEASLYRFLTRLARNTVVDVARAIRTRKREARVDPLVHSDWSRSGVRGSDLSAPGPGPATRVAGEEEEVRLQRAFETLAADHRRVIGLRQFEGLTAADAGRRLGRSETAVHSLYRRALQAWAEAAQT